MESSGPNAWLRAWRHVRAPLLGLLLGWGVVKGVDRLRIARLSPQERSQLAHEHCVRAQAICDEECLTRNVGPIILPEDVIEEMIDEYSRALEIDSGHLEALHSRAYWREFIGDPAGALDDYDDLLRRDAGNALAWYQRGGLLCDRGDHTAAIADYTRSLEIQPHRPGSAVLGARARCRRESGDWRGALADLEAEGGYDRLSIADCRQALGEHAEAVKGYDAWLRSSSSTEILYRRGVSKFSIGDRDGALEDFTRACQNDGSPRADALTFIREHPGDPMSDLLQEALRPLPEAVK
ncbi:MAG: tetratricopeptide repeat protein [Planctomycetes bacterium]|nr:tetratricopeptide repeat protein [Planctomycetota bacterium]